MFSSVRLHLQPVIIRNYKSYKKSHEFHKLTLNYFQLHYFLLAK